MNKRLARELMMLLSYVVLEDIKRDDFNEDMDSFGSNGKHIFILHTKDCQRTLFMKLENGLISKFKIFNIEKEEVLFSKAFENFYIPNSIDDIMLSTYL